MGRRVRGLSGEAMNAIYLYGWPGNVRELENAMEHAFVHSRGALIQMDDLPRHLVQASPEPASVEKGLRDEALDSFERKLIVRHLEEAHWRRTVAARRLGISPVTLWRKMKRYGIEPIR
jgi:DNA-binding NtrC family response regulator